MLASRFNNSSCEAQTPQRSGKRFGEGRKVKNVFGPQLTSLHGSGVPRTGMYCSTQSF